MVLSEKIIETISVFICMMGPFVRIGTLWEPRGHVLF